MCAGAKSCSRVLPAQDAWLRIASSSARRDTGAPSEWAITVTFVILADNRSTERTAGKRVPLGVSPGRFVEEVPKGARRHFWLGAEAAIAEIG